MTKEERFPELYQLSKDLRKKFGGRVHQNRGHLFSVYNQSREKKIEIGISEHRTLIIIEGLKNSDLMVSTNKKNQWRYPNTVRKEKEKKTFYLGNEHSEKDLDAFLMSLTDKMKILLLGTATWFNHEIDSWFIEIPTNNQESILNTIHLLENESQPVGGLNSVTRSALH